MNPLRDRPQVRGAWFAAACMLATLAATPAGAEERCFGTGGPGATLLFPYFEADLAGPAGPTTLLSIGNAVPRPVLGHVVLWTNRGLPVLDFDLFLPAWAVVPLDLGSVLREGRLPMSGTAGGDVPFAGCSSPVALPILDAAALELLRRRLSGLPGEDDLCWASPADGSVVTGFVTVDAVGACSATPTGPLDDGYFGEGGPAVADDVLWGELYLVDSSQDAAQGLSAVALAAVEGPGAPGTRSFYQRGDGRQPLPVLSRHRFLNGGGFDGGTEVLVWLDPFAGERPQPGLCGTADFHAEKPLFTEERRESGELGLMAYGRTELVAGRFPLVPNPDAEIWAVTAFSVAGAFGSLKVCASEPPQDGQGGEATLRGLWAAPLHTALGRYSVGVDALRRCDGELPESPTAGPVPEWLRRWIVTLECAPVELTHEIRSYRYQGETVYFYAQPCCDRFQEVYDEDGAFLCAPAGGFSGQGDGRCPDFFAVATDEELVWQDPRICELPENLFGSFCGE